MFCQLFVDKAPVYLKQFRIVRFEVLDILVPFLVKVILEKFLDDSSLVVKVILR